MKDFKDKLMKNLGYIITIIDVALYFILSWITIEDFQTNIATILINGALIFVGALVANMSLMEQGLLNGRESKIYKDTLFSHIQARKIIYSKLDQLQEWLDKDYLTLLKIGRSVFVNSAGYNYEDVFNEDGKFKVDFVINKPQKLETKNKIKICFRWLLDDNWKLYREKKKFINKARRYKITRLKVTDLMNVEANKDPNNFGLTEKQYVSRKSALNLFSKLFFSIMLPSVSFGFYGFNARTFFTQLISIVLILTLALFSMFSAYSFMVKSHRESIIMKINKMEEFDNNVKIKEKNNDTTHTEIPVCAKSRLVEEIQRQDETGQ